MQLLNPTEADVMIEASNGKKLPGIVVFGRALEYLKREVSRMMNDAGVTIGHDNVLWILTVPAIWTPAAKQIMRRAAEFAKLFSKPYQLKLALEPEAASLVCRKDKEIIAKPNFKPGLNYMVLDWSNKTKQTLYNEQNPHKNTASLESHIHHSSCLLSLV